jgi:ATP-dependent exoDNAse (exonuclease V) beta subunit
MTVAFTPEQLAAVERRDGPMLLSANAGSGKTAVLTERVVRAVLEDGLALDELLVITFTEKAAGELRSRIREGLGARGARAQARDTERAWISTIHGFCARVLRAHAVAAGLDPSFAVLDEATGRRLRAAAWDEALAAFMDGEDPAVGRPEALELAGTWGPDRLQRAIEQAHGALRAQGMTHPRLPPCRPRRTVAAAAAALAVAYADLLAELPAGAGASLAAARDALGTCGELLARGPEPAQAALGGLRFPRKGKALTTPAAATYLARVDELEQAFVDREACAVHGLLDELLAGYAAAYAARKRGRSALDFDDLELGARDLLAAAPAVAEAYATRFSRIMVDEFQDTNDLQMQLLGFLDRDNVFLVGDELQSIYGFRHADVAVFRAQRRRHEALDRAPALAQNWRTRPELLQLVNGAWGAGHDAYVPLVPGRPEAGDGPRAELLVADAAWDVAGAPGPRALEAALRAGMPAGTRLSRLAEARAVARRLRALCDAGQATPEECVVLTRAATDLHVFERALEREGFATLASAGRGYWLRQPVQDLTAYLAVLANPHDDLALYGALASPLCGLSSDGLAHVAAAARAARRRPWEVLGEDGLTARLGGRDAARLRGFLGLVVAERAGAPRRGLDEVLDRAVLATGYDLHVLRLPGGRRRLANVHKLVRLAGAFEEARGRDLRGFIDHARAEVEAEAREGEAPIELRGSRAVRLMTIHAAKGLEFGTVVVADLGRHNQSRLPDLLVDGSRVGLRLVRMGESNADALDYPALKAEAQAAALAEERRVLHVAVTRAEERLILSGVAALGDAWARESATAPALSWLGRALGEALPQRLAAEGELELDELRLLGRVRLVARAVSPATAPATLGLSPPAPEQLELPLDGGAARAPAEAPGAGPGTGAGAGAGPGARPASLAAAPPAPRPQAPAVPAPAHLSYTQLAEHAACGYRYYLRRGLGMPEQDPPPGVPAAAEPAAAPEPAGATEPASEALDPRLRGVVVHALLEHAAPGGPPGPALLEDVLAELDLTLTPAQAREALALAGAFAATPLAARAAAAPVLRREAGFDLPLDPADPEAPLLTGVVDLLAEEADGTALVVDYKTDRLTAGEDLEAHVAGRYGIQRALYALAALQAGAPRAEVAHVFLERPAEPAVARFGAGDLEELRAAVRAHAAPLLAGQFPVTEEPHAGLCGTCPGRGTLCPQPEALTLRPFPVG